MTAPLPGPGEGPPPAPPTDRDTRLRHLYPPLAALPADALDEVLHRHAQWAEVPAGSVLFEAGAPCQGFPLVLSGAIQVARGAHSGRSLELYRVTPGELCVVSTAGLFGTAPMSAFGRSVEATELVLLTPAGFERCLAFEPFRRHVFGVFADRLADLMVLAEAVAFQRLDQRLAGALLGHGSPLRSTHQALADELGTAREMVTRLLKRFEQAGWVRLGRERIDLLDSPALRQLAGGEARRA